ncbi:hypothetical protein LC612_38570, partial [Nostoc sp. CHAB 5834]|nr:hypothetical protein [Nostoc sp. CHAB 5834]
VFLFSQKYPQTSAHIFCYLGRYILRIYLLLHSFVFSCRPTYQGDLPFSQRTINLVKDIMVREQTPDYTLRGKTGWLTSTKPNIGWFVGYLEENKNVYFFATTLDMDKVEDAPARIEITRRSLKDLGLLAQIN